MQSDVSISGNYGITPVHISNVYGIQGISAGLGSCISSGRRPSLYCRISVLDNGFLEAVRKKEGERGLMGHLEWLIILVGHTPALIFWIAAITFGIVMLRRGGSTAERFFIAGAGIKLLGSLLTVLWISISYWLHREVSGITDYQSIVEGINLFLDIIGALGLLLLIHAFWLKFKEWKSPENGSTLLERGSHDTIPEY